MEEKMKNSALIYAVLAMAILMTACTEKKQTTVETEPLVQTVEVDAVPLPKLGSRPTYLEVKAYKAAVAANNKVAESKMAQRLPKGSRVIAVRDFYKGCTGVVVGRGNYHEHRGTEIDLDESCDKRQLIDLDKSPSFELIKK